MSNKLHFGVVVMLAALMAVGCTDIAPEQRSSCRLDKDLMLYSTEFAEIYGLPIDEATDLPEGLLAIRGYWTEFVHAKGRPYLQMQLYLDDTVSIPFPHREGTLAYYESQVRSGFEYFPAKRTLRVDPEAQHNEFHNRILLHNASQGTNTEIVSRYKRALAPGVTAVEFSTVFTPPYDIYLYVGDKPKTGNIYPLFFSVSSGEDISNNVADFHVLSIPDQFGPLLDNDCP
ncbi:MAG: hypothetical protein LAT63_07480 [Marinobacter sp.]|nr:hypothetical protein [Marinobacter sp.]